MTAPKLPNGRIDAGGLTKPIAEDSFRSSDQTPCENCGHSLGGHGYPHNGRWYWACLAPIGVFSNTGDRPECGCTER